MTLKPGEDFNDLLARRSQLPSDEYIDELIDAAEIKLQSLEAGRGFTDPLTWRNNPTSIIRLDISNLLFAPGHLLS